MTTLYVPNDDVLGLQLAANYTAGSGSMTLKTGQGAKLASLPTLITVVVNADYQTGTGEIGNKASYVVSAVAGDVLTVAVASGSTDRNFSANDYVDCRPEALYLTALNAAIAALQTALNGPPAGMLKAAGGTIEQAVAGTDYVVPSGSCATITGSIAESQVTGLTADLAAKAPLASPTFTGTPAAPTAPAATNTTQLATTAYVQSQGYVTSAGAAAAAPVQSVAGKTGAVTLAGTDVPAFGASGTGHAQGTVPDPGASAGTTRFLREDATWATPAGGGGSPGGSSGQLQYNSSSAFAGAANLTVGSSGQLNFAAQAAPASPANGDQWHDSTQHAEAFRQTGMTVFRPGVIYVQTAVAAATAAATTSLIATAGAVGTVNLPAGFLNVAGRTLRVRGSIFATTAPSSPGNITLNLLLGSTTVASSFNYALGANINGNGSPLPFEIVLTTLSTGVSGTLGVGGFAVAHAGVTLISYPCIAFGVTTLPPTLDLTQSYTLDLQCVLTASGNTINLYGLTVEVLA